MTAGSRPLLRGCRILLLALLPGWPLLSVLSALAADAGHREESADPQTPGTSMCAAPTGWAAGDAVLPSAPPEFALRARQEIQAVLHGPDFSGHETRTTWVPRIKPAETGEDSGWLAWINAAALRIAAIVHWFAQIGSWLLWTVAGLLVLALVWWRRSWWMALLGRAAAVPSTPIEMKAPVLRPAGVLPDDPAAAATRAWEEGDHEGALSLLYRSALQRLAARYALVVPSGATESETQRLVAASGAPGRSGFSTLTQAWIRLAYGRQSPPDLGVLLAAWQLAVAEAP